MSDIVHCEKCRAPVTTTLATSNESWCSCQLYERAESQETNAMTAAREGSDPFTMLYTPRYSCGGDERRNVRVVTTGVFLDIHSGRIPQVWAYRTGLASQMRGILAERGIVFAQSIARARREIPAVVADISNALAPLAREMLADLMDQLRELDKRIGVQGQ